jgi:hypothetical protein
MALPLRCAKRSTSLAVLFALSVLPAFAMTDIDRRLNVAVVGFDLNTAAAKAALSSGADINHRNEALGNETMLITAIKGQKDPAVIRFLIENGADPGLKDDAGRTALDYARQYGIGRDAQGREIIALLQGGPRASAAPHIAPPAQPAMPAAAVPAPPPPRVAVQAPAPPRVAATPVPTAPAPAATAGFVGAWPQSGVYECYNQLAATVPLMFGLLDRSTYMSSDGHKRSYVYDVNSGVLTLDPGAMPARYQRVGATSFRLLRDNGELGGFVCPLNKAKNPSRPPW